MNYQQIHSFMSSRFVLFERYCLVVNDSVMLCFSLAQVVFCYLFMSYEPRHEKTCL